MVDEAERAEALAELLVCMAFVVDGVEGYMVRGVAGRADEGVEGITGGFERRATRERPSPQGGQVRRRVRAEQDIKLSQARYSRQSRRSSGPQMPR